VPETGRYALRFESVNHKADVWVDGRRVGGHTGTYLPFEVRPRLETGRRHTLVVRADWRDPMGMKAEGWHRAWFNFGGINREVTIRPVTGPEVPSASLRTRLDGGTARVEVRARLRASAGTQAGEGPIRLSGTLRRGDRSIPLRFPATTVRPGVSRQVRATATIPKAALWAPGRPALHALELRVSGRPAWRGRVGLREIRRQGTTILLNGRPLKLRGASLHEDVPGRGDGLRAADEARLVSELERLGANATRAQHPLSPSLLEKLDAKGILVWLGVGPVDAPGAWTSRGPRLVAQAKERVRRSLAQLQTHPSILAWNLANEVAGQGHPAGQAPYIDAMARELKRRDPGRLVGLDVWGSHPPKFAGPMYSAVDAIGYTNYLGWYEQPYATPEQLEQLIRTKVGELQAVFPDKALVVTEFGAEGSPRNPANEPGGHAFQARVLRTHIRTYGDIPGVSGMLVWNLRDFAVIPSFGGGSIREVVDKIVLVPGLNEKGLHTYAGRPKPAAQAVKREFARLTRAG
jgi:beta-galactosidase/beta-glucuronidase